MNSEPMQDKPQDLSIKSGSNGSSSSSSSNGGGNGRKIKNIPPPLDLNARTLLEPEAHLHHLRLLPKSPSELPRECLPIRKRPLLEVRKDLHDTKSPKSAGPNGVSTPYAAFVNSPADIAITVTSASSSHTAPSSPLASVASRITTSTAAAAAATLALTPSSASSLSSSAFSHFPVPPPPSASSLLGHHHSHHQVAAAVAAAANLPKSPYFAAAAAAAAAAVAASSPAAASASCNGFPTPPTDLHSPHYPWPSPSSLFPTPFSPSALLPHSPLSFPASSTALLSPAPSSYPSSTNSSREDLPPAAANNVAEQEAKRRLLSSAPGVATSSALLLHPHHRLTAAAAAAPPVGADSSTSPGLPPPSSPLLPSPRNSWSTHSWPTPAWQCFVKGTQVKFLIPNLDTPWQTAEELGWKDHIAMKVDAKNNYQYAPNGLTVIKIEVISREKAAPTSLASGDNSAFTPVPRRKSSSVSEDEVSPAALQQQQQQQQMPLETVLRLRMSPHLGDNSAEILAECQPEHPFFVRDRGWCSAYPRLTVDRYGIPCGELRPGDVCLPPNHPEAVRTPDLCDRFRRFEFASPSTPTEETVTTTTSTAAKASKAPRSSSPPPSPAVTKSTSKKEPKDENKPKRPMNGFMLFAKKYRLELIQQHPGKDNRAISVLLGEAWKSLPQEEREQYSHRAKLMADEQKKLYPDCWKRKRTSTSAGSKEQKQQTNVATTPTTPTTMLHQPHLNHHQRLQHPVAAIPPPPHQHQPHFMAAAAAAVSAANAAVAATPATS